MGIPCLGSKQRKNVKGSHPFWNWIGSLFFAAMAATLIRWMIMGLYVIPSGSMEPTLLTGDFILVSKLHYGARTPVTPLQLPITHGNIPGTQIPAYLDWIQLPSYRLPGLSKVKQNDIIVFNTPIGNEPPDLREYWIKRCVALPGDVVCIDHKQLYVNDKLTDLPNKVQYRYFMKTKRNLTPAFFERNDIKNPVRSHTFGQEGYTIYATPEKIKELTRVLPHYMHSIEPVEDQQEGSGTYPFSLLKWTKDHFGPLTVPKKGMTIPMDAQNILLYGHTIKKFEEKKEVHFTQTECWIDGQPVTYYTFCKNYYFAMGDNRDQSADSRFIGFIPEDYILGKAIMVLLSVDRNSSFFSGIRWNRLCHKAG